VLACGVDRNIVARILADHRVAELFYEEAVGLVKQPVPGPRHHRHQRQKCKSGKRQWMFHIRP
jgi:hypothetical protein